MEEDVQRYWDEQVATVDEEPDHGLAAPGGSACVVTAAAPAVTAAAG
jgi:hypothetical protein